MVSEALLLTSEALLLAAEALLLDSETYLLETEVFLLETEAFLLEAEGGFPQKRFSWGRRLSSLSRWIFIALSSSDYWKPSFPF